MTSIGTIKLAINSRLGAVARPGGGVCSGMDSLLPGFAAQIELVLADMRAAGHEPRVFETWRSKERVAILVERGTGSANSMHPRRIAVDIIDEVKMWNASPLFWRDLTRLAEARGLTAGSRWARGDLPHLQAVPFKDQAAFLRVTLSARDAFCATYYRVPGSVA